MRWKHFYFFLILLILLADQSTKIIISNTIASPTNNKIEGSEKKVDKIVVIPGFFDLIHIHNRGAIFGFFSQSEKPSVYIVLTVASLLALVLVVYYFFKTPSSEKAMKISLSLILGGALGNLIDRVIRGYVIDFADFYVGRLHWPAFNVADSCITIGALLLIFVLLKVRKNVSHTG
jgi:signal peptidase II